MIKSVVLCVTEASLKMVVESTSICKPKFGDRYTV